MFGVFLSYSTKNESVVRPIANGGRKFYNHYSNIL